MRCVLAITLLLLALPAGAVETATPGAAAVPPGVVNRLVVNRMGPGAWVQSGGGQELSLKAQTFVLAGQTLRTSRASGLEIKFYGDGVLTLLESTLIRLEDPGRAGEVSKVFLFHGVVFIAHDPDPKSGDGPKEVEIRTHSASVHVTGTRVLVSAEPGSEGTTSVTVIEGKAEVVSLDVNERETNEKVSLCAVGCQGDKTLVNKGKRPETPWKADPGLLRLALELWKPGAPLLEGDLTDAVLLLVAPH